MGKKKKLNNVPVMITPHGMSPFVMTKSQLEAFKKGYEEQFGKPKNKKNK